MWDDLEKGMFYYSTSVVLVWYLYGENVVKVSDVATLNMSTTLHDFLYFCIIFHYRFDIFKVAKSGMFSK